MKKLFKYTWAVIALSALTACSSNDSISDGGQTPVAPTDPNAGKELIAFSPEGISGTTRAAGDPTGFTSNTKVIMRIKAQNGAESSYRYTQAVATASAQTTANDDCNTKYGLAGKHSHLSYESNYHRYWDDAFGRTSKLTVYAVAVPDKTDASKITNTMLDQEGTKVDENYNPNWYTISTAENTKVDWTVSTQQNATTFADEDLVISNNIRDGITSGDNMKGRYHQEYNTSTSVWDKSMEYGRLEWEARQSGETTGKFDQGHLVFQHALSHIDIRLNEGSGFDNNSASDFKFTHQVGSTGQNLTLTGFNTSGKIDLSIPIDPTSGTDNTNLWTGISSSPITQLKETVTDGSGVTQRKLEGYVIPGTNLFAIGTNVLEFEIDEAKYYVTGTQIANAIRNYYKEGGGNYDSRYSSFTTLQAGRHYIINLTVGKTKIDNITAAILPWEDVNSAETVAANTYCTFNFEDRGAKISTDLFNIYRAAKQPNPVEFITNTTTANYDWKTGYDATAATKNYESDHWKTNWFWENNQTYYHFRAAGINASGAVTITTDATDGDYYAIQHGPLTGGSYKDWLWGAPFNDVDDNYKFYYDHTDKGFAYKENGTDPQISKAIGATDQQINMLLFHMTSQIKVNLKTTTDESAVVLHEAAAGGNPEKVTTVKIVNFLPTGKVRMGTGLVVADGVRVAAGVAMTTGTPDDAASPKTYNNFTYGMVPQALTGSWGTIGLEITTPDNNKYYVRDLSTVTGTVSETNVAIPYSGSSQYTINEWYPHYTYIYTITLKKNAIQNITAAVLPWETVTGDNIKIDLEN